MLVVCRVNFGESLLFNVMRILGWVIIIVIGAACTLNEAVPATLSPVPSPSELPPSATNVPPTATQTVAATSTATPAPTDTDIPPSSTIIPQVSSTPTLEPNVSLRPPNQRTYAYDQPGPDGSLIRLIQSNQYIRVIGRTPDSAWLQVEFSDNAKGWVTESSVTTTVNIEALAITGAVIPSDFIGTVKLDADGLRLRQSPHVAENIVLFLTAGESLIVDGRLADDSWLQVRRVNGVNGWVMRGFVDISFDLTTVNVVAAPAYVEPIVEVQPTSGGAVDQPTQAPVEQATQIPVDQPTQVPVQQPTTLPEQIIINEGQVNEEARGLRLREMPSFEARVFFNLEELTPITVNGRSEDSLWVLIDTPSQGEGWVVTQYLDLFFDLSAIQVIPNPTPVQNAFAPPELIEAPTESQPDTTAPTTPSSPAGFTPGNYVFKTGIKGAGNIYAHGQSLGNNPFLFTKVGDSLTATAGFLYQIAWQNYSLGDEYAYLQPVIDHFGSSYGHTGKSMLSGWKTYSVLMPEFSDQAACLPNEVPLQCEYRITRPAFALILLGTNDVYENSAAVYEANMRDIIEISIDSGVVPIVSTVPLRTDQYSASVQAYSNVVRRLAGEYNVPLWDLYNEVFNLPNNGLSSDKVHLSAPGEDLNNTANFTGNNLQYGMNVRNLSALKMLLSMLQSYVW